LLKTTFPKKKSKKYPLNSGNRPVYKNEDYISVKIDDGTEKSMPDFREATHKDVTMPPIVRPHLWDQARWLGTGFLGYLDGSNASKLLLIFENSKAASELWSTLVKDLNSQDPDECLRLSIIKGVSKNDPFHYRITFSPSENYMHKSKGGLVMLVGRSHTMTPDNHTNLNRFTEDYKKHGEYNILPAEVRNGQPYELKGAVPLSLKKLLLRNAYEIGKHDLDSPYILLDDDPIIPDDAPDAPVLELIQYLKNKAQS
jgi:hypothetical protein